MYKKESPGRLAGCFPPHFSHSLSPPRNASLQQCVGPIEEAEGMQRSFQRESVDQGSSAMKPESYVSQLGYRTVVMNLKN